MAISNLPIFVYGTLKQGYKNHKYIEGVYSKVETGMIKGKLYSVGSFPALTGGSSDIKGEIYYFDDDIFPLVIDNLDFLEGYDAKYDDGMYVRKIKKIVNSDGKHVDCYVYIWNRKVTSLTPIEKF